MREERKYSFMMGTFNYGDAYAKSSTIWGALSSASYSLDADADIIICTELGINCDLPEDYAEREAFVELLETKRMVYEALKDTKTVYTHYGDDLDNKAAIEALRRYAIKIGAIQEGEALDVQRVPAGQVKEGFLNVDTGGHKGNRRDDDKYTVVVDGDPANGIKSACQSLAAIGVYVPEQICELADARPAHISALDSRTGLALARYLSGEQLFRLAESHLLDQSLTDEQLEEFGLTEAHLKQQGIIDAAVEKINKYTVELPSGEKMVLSPEMITAGSAIAYEMGIPYYASVSQHRDTEKNPDGVTFAISCKPGMKLPQEILEYGRALVEQYRIDDKTSGVFVNPNEQLIVAGGPKNPDFKIEGHTPESMLEELRAVLMGDKEKSFEDRIVSAATERVQLKDTLVQAKALEGDFKKQVSPVDIDIDD